MTRLPGRSPLTRPRRGQATALLLVVLMLLASWPVLARPALDPPPARANDAPAQPATPAARAKTPPTAAPGPRPAVVSRTKEKQAAKGSEFLRPPGVDRYGNGDDDGADVPAWRQTTFFGIRARGLFFIYVVDCSGSMVFEDRLERAKDELRRCIRRLIDPQRFQVIFYNDQAIPMPGGLPRSADLAAKGQLIDWLRLIHPDGETNPQPALSMALSLRPDAIFLLSDGDFPEGTAEGVARRNPRKVPIHCIDLSGGEAGDQLRQIAQASGGQFVSRPWAGQ